MVKGRRVYALRVRGLSMVDALIDDGDVVIMEPVGEYRDGEVVAVLLRDSGEVTLKRLYREGDKVRLQPANALIAPVHVPADKVDVQGRLVGVIRQYPNQG